MGKDHAHLVFYGLFHRVVAPVRNRDIQITIVFGIRFTTQSALDRLTFGDGDCRWSVKYSLPLMRRRSGPRIDRTDSNHKTYFQWVYFACGPVEKFTFLCVRANEISNQARKAWTSMKPLHDRILGEEGRNTDNHREWRSARTGRQMRDPLSWP